MNDMNYCHRKANGVQTDRVNYKVYTPVFQTSKGQGSVKEENFRTFLQLFYGKSYTYTPERRQFYVYMYTLKQIVF